MSRVAVAERISLLIQEAEGFFITVVTRGAHWSRQLVSIDVRVFALTFMSSVERITLRAGVAVNRASHNVSLLWASR